MMDENERAYHLNIARQEREQYTVADALNNAIAAIYANVGPSAPLVDIRRAMWLLGITEDERAKRWANRGSGYLPTPVTIEEIRQNPD